MKKAIVTVSIGLGLLLSACGVNSRTIGCDYEGVYGAKQTAVVEADGMVRCVNK
jgi:hypothetical protein